jgi:hypothetical protein
MNLPTIINLPRGGGKTTALVYASAVNRIPILCLGLSHKGYIKELAKKLGVDIPEPLTCNPNDLSRIGGLGAYKVLVDNAEVVIPEFIREKLGIEIAAMTMSVPMVHPEQKTFSENQIDELVETIKSRSFKETAYEAAQRLQKTWKDFGFSIN